MSLVSGYSSSMISKEKNPNRRKVLSEEGPAEQTHRFLSILENVTSRWDPPGFHFMMNGNGLTDGWMDLRWGQCKSD